VALANLAPLLACRHLPGSANLLGPWYLEMFTKTEWYVVPLIWVPIFSYLFYRSFEDLSLAGLPFSDALTRTTLCFLLGNAIWTIIEYGMHRWIFHVEAWLPDHPYALSAHFLLHGIHHYLPMDGLRLVMPPILFTALQYPFTQLAYKLFPVWTANGIISGAFAFYVVYDCFHYAMHHMKLPRLAKGQKSWHMEHHYKEPNLGFGVSSPIWDWVFGTEFVSRPKNLAK
jgi:4-hydroxysphinganine ceramide fatty acyl 2-hydroxylase